MFLNKEVMLDDMVDIMLEKLNSGGTVTFSPRGKSMLPMLRDGEDVVVLSKPNGRLHLFDVPLYRRCNGGFALHRIVDFDINGNYILCGDNQFEVERGIKDSDIVAVMTAFYRKGKAYPVSSFRYKLYLNFWYYTRIIRRVYRGSKNRMKRLLKKENKTENNEKRSD